MATAYTIDVLDIGSGDTLKLPADSPCVDVPDDLDESAEEIVGDALENGIVLIEYITQDGEFRADGVCQFALHHYRRGQRMLIQSADTDDDGREIWRLSKAL